MELSAATPIQQVAVPVKRGAELYCTIEVVWELILSRQFKCGQKFKRVMRRKTGVTRDQREDLEATIKGSYGIKGLAQLAASLKASTQYSIKFEKSQEVEETIEVRAPEFGRFLLLIYQKKLVYNFRGSDSRFFRQRPWVNSVECWLDEYLDQSMRFEYDPDCKGKEPPELRPPDGFVNLGIEGKLTLSEPYRLTEEGIEFINLGLRTGIEMATFDPSRARIPSEALPVIPRFLAGITKKRVDMVFFPPQPSFLSVWRHPIQEPTIPQLLSLKYPKFVLPETTPEHIPHTFDWRFQRPYWSSTDPKELWHTMPIRDLPIVKMEKI